MHGNKVQCFLVWHNVKKNNTNRAPLWCDLDVVGNSLKLVVRPIATQGNVHKNTQQHVSWSIVQMQSQPKNVVFS